MKKNIFENLVQKNEMERDILEEIMENTKTNLAYLDANFNFIRVNSAYIKGSGYTKHDLIGKNHFQLFPDKENQKIFKQVKRTGQAVEFLRKPFLFPDHPEKGVTFWDWTLVPVKDNKKKVQGFVFSLTDVTDEVKKDQEREELLVQIDRERQRVEQLALEEEKRASELEAVFMALSDTLFVYDKNGICVSANPAALKLMGSNPVGFSRDQIANKLKIHGPDGQTFDSAEFPSTKVLNGENFSEKKIVVENFKGEVLTMLATAAPIKYGQKVIGVVAMLHDISERERLEKEKDAFIAIASHELKTPVTTLKAFTQILQTHLQCAKNDTCRNYLGKIDFQISKLSGLINEMLDATRVEFRKLDLKTEWFDFDQLINEIVSDFQPTFPTHKIVVQGSVGQKIKGDKERLSQVLINLLLNAVKYSPQAQKVVININLSQNVLQVSVQDFGIGIAKENQDRVFDRFFRVNSSDGQRFPGLGLGLFICSEIIKRHQGKIWVESKEGKGSIFFFTLPVKK